MNKWQRIRRLARKSPYGVRTDGTPIIPTDEQSKLVQPQLSLPPEAVVYSGPLPEWAQKRIDSILDERGLSESDRR